MNSIRDLLSLKGGDVWSVPPEDIIYDALVLMADNDIGSVLVMDGDQLVGIFTLSDYVRKIVLCNRSSRNTMVQEAMSTPVYTISLYASIRDCMELMLERKIRYLPVVHEGRLQGVISIGDVMREIIFEQGTHIRFWQDLAVEF